MSAMKKQKLSKLLKPDSSVSDVVDRLVHRIVTRVRGGETVDWPGLGRFKPGANAKIEFETRRGKERPK